MPADRDTSVQAWIRARAPQWQALAADIAAAPRGRGASVDEASATLRTYRSYGTLMLLLLGGKLFPNPTAASIGTPARAP